jgi:hypothetical protein
MSMPRRGTGRVYGFERHGLDKTQVDIAWTAGLVCRFGCDLGTGGGGNARLPRSTTFAEVPCR